MQYYDTGREDLRIRDAAEQDTALIFDFIRQLASYEKMLDDVVATEETMREWVFEKDIARCLIAELQGEPVGFALYFFNYSTFVGRGGVYLEDLFVLPECRGKGVGKALLRQLARICVELGCGRMEWACLDWNRPSIDFYRSLGAQPLEEWTTYRLTGEALRELGKVSP